ncbi:MAG TPA: hypothetical protein VES73_15490 [Lamprocystis sp. (in: g-proteobacteria)]|nr:hypothetical protein [Lamprocystis sp. (in: g-proteobacteria)]
MSTIPTAYPTIIDPPITVAQRIVEPDERRLPVTLLGNLTT